MSTWFLFKRYNSTAEFLDYLDSLYKGSGLQSLRNDPKYQQLLNRWNLPVYFQIRYKDFYSYFVLFFNLICGPKFCYVLLWRDPTINPSLYWFRLNIFYVRFQELAGQLETCLSDPFAPADRNQSPYNLKSTDSLMNTMNACFSTDVFLPPLAHRYIIIIIFFCYLTFHSDTWFNWTNNLICIRFWKLCLQLMARFQLKFRDILLEVFYLFSHSNYSFLTKIEFIKVKQVDATSSLAKSSSSTKLMELESSSGIPSSATSLQHLVQLDADISLILENSPNVWNNAWKRLELLGLKDPTNFQSNN